MSVERTTCSVNTDGCIVGLLMVLAMGCLVALAMALATNVAFWLLGGAS